MRRRSLLLVVALLAAAPVAAEVAASGQRFEIAPAGSADGVTRVDTRTGVVSHCTPSDGVWFCDRLPDPAATSTPAPAPGDLKRLSDAIAAIGARVESLAAKVGDGRPAPLTTASSAASGERPAPSFAAAAVQRLMQMVRRLKHRDA